MARNLTIALLGTRGVPARYGGFETAVEEVGARLADAGHRVVVYSRERGPGRYRGMRVVHMPTLRTKYTETIVHSFLSAAHALFERPDVVMVFNAANAPAAIAFRPAGIPFALHVDGLEWQRGKWGRVGRSYYLGAERLGARTANALIADSAAIGAYYARRYNVRSHYIPYGAPTRSRGAWAIAKLEELDLHLDGFHLVIARFEPENHVREILASFATARCVLPMVVVGSAPYGDNYVAEIRDLALRDPRIRLTGTIWDQELLDALYVGCASYVHGHSVGGTNPSLLRAAGAGAWCIAYDVEFNREVLGDSAEYFVTEATLRTALERVEEAPMETREAAYAIGRSVAARYTWDRVASQYEALARALADSR